MSLHTSIFFSLHEIQDMATSLQVPPGVTMAAIPADVHVCCTHEGHEYRMQQDILSSCNVALCVPACVCVILVK